MNEITDFEAPAPTDAANLTIVSLPGEIQSDNMPKIRSGLMRYLVRMIGWPRRR